MKLSLYKIDIVMGLISFSLGLFVLCGWLFQIEGWKHIQPGLMQMKVNTSICFISSGLSLICLRFGRKHKTFLLIARFNACLIGLVALITCCEYIFQWQSGIDQLIAEDFSPQSYCMYAGRMTMETAISFFILSVALLFASTQQYWSIIQILSFIVLALSYLTLHIYLFSAIPESFLTGGALMAVHTAFGLFCLAAGIFAISSNYGVLKGVRRYWPLLMLIFAVWMMSVSGVSAYRRVQKDNEIATEIESANRTQELLEDVLADMHIMTASEYGYIITRNSKFFEPITEEKKSINTTLQQLRNIHHVYPSIPDIDSLSKLIDLRLFITDNILLATETKGSQTAIALVSAMEGEAIDSQIRDKVEGFKKVVEKLVLEKKTEESIINSSGVISLGFTGLSGLSLLIIALLTQQRQLVERQVSEEAIKTLAFYDPLTKLPNRRMLLERLERSIQKRNPTIGYGALFYLDLDNFKHLNDVRGHQIGDELLISVARRLQQCVRIEDTVARLGGDEFVVLIDSMPGEQDIVAANVKTIAEKISKKLAIPHDLPGGAHQCPASLGITLFNNHNAQVSELIVQADTAMYTAKQAGKNRICFFDKNMQESLNHRATMDADMREAIRSEQFQLYYQIQVDQDQRSVGAEALIRWMHPTKGMISPMEFISFAEQNDHILELGAWVLDKACSQLVAWRENGYFQKLTMSVNVSAKQFYHDSFLQTIHQMIERYQLHAGELKLEITESMLLNELDIAVERVNALKKMGVMLSMDDFGTGYSSLSYLRALAFDQIKIDKSFVHDIHDINSKNRIIISSIMSIGKTMGMSVIAEGVENDAEYRALKELGCQEFQGYYFGRPVNATQFEVQFKDSM